MFKSQGGSMMGKAGWNYRGIEDPHQAPLSLFSGTELCYLQVKGATLKPTHSIRSATNRLQNSLE